MDMAINNGSSNSSNSNSKALSKAVNHTIPTRRSVSKDVKADILYEAVKDLAASFLLAQSIPECLEDDFVKNELKSNLKLLLDTLRKAHKAKCNNGEFDLADRIAIDIERYARLKSDINQGNAIDCEAVFADLSSLMLDMDYLRQVCQ